MYIVKQPKEVLLAVEIINKLSDKPMMAKTLADEMEEGHAFVQRIVYKLGKAGLIKVVRGPGGGAVLNPEQQGLTLSNVYLALGRVHEVEGEESPTLLTSALILSLLSKIPVIFPKEELKETIAAETQEVAAGA
jgi:DNA-binding IscR family transcriptional regulator